MNNNQQNFIYIHNSIHKLQLKLFSLDLQLKEYFNTGIISSKQYKKRSKKILKLIQALEILKANLQLITSTNNNDKNNFGVDVIIDGEQERKICVVFLLDKVKSSINVIKQLNKILFWIQNLSVPYFINALRLSSLRKKLNKLEHHTFLEEQNCNILQLNVEKMNSQFVSTASDKKQNQLQGLEHINAILQLYSNINLTSLRINRLREAIAKEEETISRMQNYLAQEALRLKVKAYQSESTLNLQAINMFQNEFSQEFSNKVSNVEKQLTLARDFITQRLNSNINIEIQNTNIKNSLIMPELHYPSIKRVKEEEAKIKRGYYVS